MSDDTIMAKSGKNTNRNTGSSLPMLETRVNWVKVRPAKTKKTITKIEFGLTVTLINVFSESLMSLPFRYVKSGSIQ